MAVRKSKKKLKPLQKFLAIIGVLILGNILFLSFYSGETPLAVRDAIDKSIQALPDDGRTKEMKRLLVSLSHYASTHGGNFPNSVNQLIPVYYHKTPIDPLTGKPFAFEIRNKIPVILGGDEDTSASSKGSSAKDGEAEKITPEAEQKQLIAAMSDGTLESAFVYDPSGKRDPFRSFDLTPKLMNDDPNKTELERYDIGQLKLTAVLDSLEEPRAIVENSQGIGFPVKKGTKIGSAGGEVVEIAKDRIAILEQSVDFTGETKSRTIELKLRETASR